MKLKSKDIAKLLNVSPATVSLVLNNKPGVSNETRQKILEILQQNSYDFSNHTAAPHMTKNIQFVIYKKHGKVVSDTPFFSMLTESLNRSARLAGFNLLITYMDEKQDDIPAILEALEQSSPTGLLILATEMTAKDLVPFKKLHCPMLLLDNQFDNQDIDTVCIDNADGVCKAVQYICSLNHRDIGYLNSKVWISNFERRLFSFRSSVSEYGIPLKESNIFRLDSTLEGAYHDLRSILERCHDMPTALFAANDIIAMGASRALREAGYRIPNDISIIGFDDMPMCEACDPPLTTIHVYNQQMATVAMKRLTELIQSPSVEVQKILIGTRLVIRKSTCVAGSANI